MMINNVNERDEIKVQINDEEVWAVKSHSIHQKISSMSHMRGNRNKKWWSGKEKKREIKTISETLINLSKY